MNASAMTQFHVMILNNTLTQYNKYNPSTTDIWTFLPPLLFKHEKCRFFYRPQLHQTHSASKHSQKSLYPSCLHIVMQKSLYLRCSSLLYNMAHNEAKPYIAYRNMNERVNKKEDRNRK